MHFATQMAVTSLKWKEKRFEKGRFRKKMVIWRLVDASPRPSQPKQIGWKEETRTKNSFTVNGFYFLIIPYMAISLRAHFLVDPVSELGDTCKHCISLCCRASRRTPANSALKYPVPCGILAHVRTSTVTMTTTKNSSTDAAANHFRGDL